MAEFEKRRRHRHRAGKNGDVLKLDGNVPCHQKHCHKCAGLQDADDGAGSEKLVHL
jgi:hypothetical protein